MSEPMLTTTACPECGNTAEVVRVSELPSTGGVVAHAYVRCADRHWFLLPAEWLSFEPDGTAPDAGATYAGARDAIPASRSVG